MALGHWHVGNHLPGVVYAVGCVVALGRLPYEAKRGVYTKHLPEGGFKAVLHWSLLAAR